MPLYTPPMWTNVQQIRGSLRYGVPTCKCVYKKNGVWNVVVTPYVGQTEGADYVFDRPTQVDSSIAAELIAFGQGTIT